MILVFRDQGRCTPGTIINRTVSKDEHHDWIPWGLVPLFIVACYRPTGLSEFFLCRPTWVLAMVVTSVTILNDTQDRINWRGGSSIHFQSIHDEALEDVGILQTSSNSRDHDHRCTVCSRVYKSAGWLRRHHVLHHDNVHTTGKLP